MKKRKNNKKILILSLLFILFLTITATQAAEIQDNTTQSDSNGITSINDVNIDIQGVSEDDTVIGDGEKSFADLTSLFEKATDRVELTDDFKYAKGDNDQGILITKDNLVINGNGHIIDGDEQAKIFIITGNNVVLKNVIIKNAYFEKSYDIQNGDIINEQHAAIVWNGENGTLDHVTIQDCYVGAITTIDPEFSTGSININGSAGIYWTGNNGQITNCIFTHNNQANSGSYINMGGALQINGMACNIKNTKFTSNTAVTGGAIRINGNNITIDDCDFTDNNATDSVAGAIRTDGYYTSIIKSTFNNNNANTQGGSIYAGNYLNITKCAFKKNNAILNEGGAILIAGIYATIQDSIFDQNTATTGAGAVRLGSFSKILKSNFTNNNITSGGGGAVNGLTNNIISECNFINCFSGTNAGAIRLGANSTYSNCIFINNTARDSSAGAIHASADTYISNSKFINNTGLDAGGIQGAGNVQVDNCIFINNSAINAAGGFYLNSPNCKVMNSIFINNTARIGGGLRASSNGPNGIVLNCTFINNLANVSNSGAGGAMDIYAENITLSDCIFMNNKGYTTGAVTTYKNTTVIKCLFINNTALQSGQLMKGALEMNENNNVIIKYNIFINATTTNNGLPNWKLKNNTVESNWYGINNPGFKVGSYLKANLVKLDDSGSLVAGEYNPIIGIHFIDSVSNEIVTELPGRLIKYTINNTNIPFIWTDSSVSGKILANNNAKQSFNISAKIDSQDLGTLVFNGENYTISDKHSFTELQQMINNSNAGDTLELHNKYQRDVFNDIPTIIINKTLTIKGNYSISGANSGVIFTILANNVVLEGLTLSDGNSAINGGAIIWTGNNGKIINVKFTNNQATGNGGAIYSTGNNTEITGSIFTNNIATDGGAIYIDANNAKLINCIFNKNTARSGTGNDVYLRGATTILNNITVSDSEHNAISIIGDNTTIKTLKLDNIKGNGLITDGTNTNILNVVMTNITGNGIQTQGANTTVTNVKAENITGNVIDTKGENTTLSGIVANNTGKVINSEGDNLKVDGVFVTNIIDDAVTFNGNNADLANIDGTNVNGTILNGKDSDNYKVSKITGTNIAGNLTKLNGNGKSNYIMPSDPAKALKIPTNPGTNTPTYTIEGLNSNVQGYFKVYVDKVLQGTEKVHNGVAKSITVNKMTPGNHTVELIFTPSGNAFLEMNQTGIVTINSEPAIILTGADVTTLYSSNEVYKVTVTADGIKIADNETVVINFNGINYNVKTVNGIASLTLTTTLKVAKYTITSSYKDKTISNVIDIKNIINANKLKKFKKSKKVTKVKVTLAKVNGKFINGANLVLKLKNKKVASAKTNTKGVATLKVKKKALKKFKAGKKVVATITYGNDIVTKKVKITK